MWIKWKNANANGLKKAKEDERLDVDQGVLDDAHNLNLDAEHSDFRKALDDYLPLRQQLVAICLSNGWCDE
jgi:hypothetical protein